MNFNEIVRTTVLREIVNNFKKEGKLIFYKNKQEEYKDITEGLFSGSLLPIIIWYMNRRLFMSKEGYYPLSIMEQFKYNVNVEIIPSKGLLGCKIGDINAEHISVSPEDFIFLLKDAIDSLYEELPLISEITSQHKNGRFINPMISKFENWRAIYVQLQLALFNDDELIDLMSDVEDEEKLTLYMIGKALTAINKGDSSKTNKSTYLSTPYSILFHQVKNNLKASSTTFIDK